MYSRECVGLCARMMNFDRARRPYAADCLKTAFIQQAGQVHVDPKMQAKIEQIRKLPRRSLLYRSVAFKIAQSWPANQFPSVKAMFEYLDKEGNGELNVHVIAYFFRQLGVPEEEATNCASAMALSRKGFVSWTEFMSVCVDLGDAALAQDLRKVFDEADRNRDGYLSLAEVGSMLAGQHLQGQALREVFQELSGSDDANTLVNWEMFHRHFMTPIRGRLPVPPEFQQPTEGRPSAPRQASVQPKIVQKTVIEENGDDGDGSFGMRSWMNEQLQNMWEGLAQELREAAEEVRNEIHQGLNGGRGPSPGPSPRRMPGPTPRIAAPRGDQTADFGQLPPPTQAWHRKPPQPSAAQARVGGYPMPQQQSPAAPSPERPRQNSTAQEGDNPRGAPRRLSASPERPQQAEIGHTAQRQNIVVQLTSMGFSLEQAQAAAKRCSSMEAAVNWLAEHAAA